MLGISWVPWTSTRDGSQTDLTVRLLFDTTIACIGIYILNRYPPPTRWLGQGLAAIGGILGAGELCVMRRGKPSPLPIPLLLQPYRGSLKWDQDDGLPTTGGFPLQNLAGNIPPDKQTLLTHEIWLTNYKNLQIPEGSFYFYYDKRAVEFRLLLNDTTKNSELAKTLKIINEMEDGGKNCLKTTFFCDKGQTILWKQQRYENFYVWLSELERSLAQLSSSAPIALTNKAVLQIPNPDTLRFYKTQFCYYEQYNLKEGAYYYYKDGNHINLFLLISEGTKHQLKQTEMIKEMEEGGANRLRTRLPIQKNGTILWNNTTYLNFKHWIEMLAEALKNTDLITLKKMNVPKLPIQETLQAYRTWFANYQLCQMPEGMYYYYKDKQNKKNHFFLLLDEKNKKTSNFFIKNMDEGGPNCLTTTFSPKPNGAFCWANVQYSNMQTWLSQLDQSLSQLHRSARLFLSPIDYVAMLRLKKTAAVRYAAPKTNKTKLGRSEFAITIPQNKLSDRIIPSEILVTVKNKLSETKYKIIITPYKVWLQEYEKDELYLIADLVETMRDSDINFAFEEPWDNLYTTLEATAFEKLSEILRRGDGSGIRSRFKMQWKKFLGSTQRRKWGQSASKLRKSVISMFETEAP